MCVIVSLVIALCCMVCVCERMDILPRSHPLILRLGFAYSDFAPLTLRQYGPLDGLVRAEIFTSGYIFKQIGDGVAELTYVVQADPKGWVPGMCDRECFHSAQWGVDAGMV